MQPAIAYAQLPVHGVTPVLDKQTNKETNEQTNKQTNKQTYKQTKNKQTNTQTHKQTNKHFNKFPLSDFFQILSEFALVNTSSRMKILSMISDLVKSSNMVLSYQSLSKITASRFVICAYPTRRGE